MKFERKTIFGCAIIAVALAMLAVSDAAALSEREVKRRELNEKYDRLNIRRKTDFVIDRSDDFLKPPANLQGEFDIAATPPEVRLQILPDMDPEYFSGDAYQAGWANWAKVVRGGDNRFFMAVGDHRGRGASINLYEYCHGKGQLKRVLDVSDTLGWHDDMYTDGKIHGRMGIMPDGTLWAATHRGPQPTEEWYDAGYRGSWLFSYNIDTGEAQNWGVPLVVNELPEHTLDTERGIFLATGQLTCMMLSWDVNEKRVRYAGSPPNGWKWHPRSMLLDRETGFFWGIDYSEEPYRFLSFDPELNRFKRHDVAVPGIDGPAQWPRGATVRPATDGWYYWATRNGVLFRFRPDWENGPEVEKAGKTWGTGQDTVQLAICPQGRYIYYVPGHYPSAVVQYDVKTGRRKALAFLQEYYFEKYGYWLGRSYGMEISEDGDFLVILENGTFEGRNRVYGHPGLLVLEIPASER